MGDPPSIVVRVRVRVKVRAFEGSTFNAATGACRRSTGAASICERWLCQYAKQFCTMRRGVWIRVRDVFLLGLCPIYYLTVRSPYEMHDNTVSS